MRLFWGADDSISAFRSTFKDLNDSFTDVILSSSNDPNEEPTFIKAHRVILSAASPLLRKLLVGMPLANSNSLLFFNGIPPEYLESVVKYIYLGEVNLDGVKIRGFLDAAQKLGLNDLVRQVERDGNSDSASKVTSPRKRKEISATNSSFRMSHLNEKRSKIDTKDYYEAEDNNDHDLDDDGEGIENSVEEEDSKLRVEPVVIAEHKDESNDQAKAKDEEEISVKVEVDQEDEEEERLLRDFSCCKSQKGFEQLIFQGNLYNLNGSGSHRRRWKCKAYKSTNCKGALSTDAAITGIYSKSIVPHSHPSSEISVQLARIRTELKKKALMSEAKPEKIVKEVLLRFPLSDPALGPHPKSFIRVIQRERKHASLAAVN